MEEVQTILVVDNEPINRSLIQRRLERAGYRVLTSPNGQDAIDISKKELPDLILLDIMLEGLDGLEVCRLVNDDEEIRDIPIIFLSARDETEVKVAALSLGAIDYITKPFKAEELLARVDIALRLKRERDHLRWSLEEARARVELPQRMTPNFNVLVVDDDFDKQMLLKIALQTAGYDVRTANNGEEALAAVESFQPDLIITDVMMPRMDGYELSRRIRANPQTKFIPIIIQSAARGDAQDFRRGAEVGALGYITDPTDLDLLLARARTLLDFKGYLDACEEAVFTDDLTSLASRRRFLSQLQREATNAQRYNRSFCLILLEIADLKRVNENFGHYAGDEALRYISYAMLKVARGGKDTAARISGGLFALICADSDMSLGKKRAQQLHHEIEVMQVPGVGAITASFGVADYPSCTQHVADLFIVADKALSKAKMAKHERIICGEKI